MNESAEGRLQDTNVRLASVSSDSTAWNRASKLFTDSLFFDHAWLSRVAQTFGARENSVIATADDEPVAVCPGMVISRGPFRVFYSAVPFGGVEGTSEGISSLLSGLPDLLAVEGIHRIRIQQLPGGDLQCTGYCQIPVLYPLLDLGTLDTDDLMGSIPGYPRRDVSRAKREGVRVRIAESSNDVDQFYRLYLLSQSRNRAFARYPRSYFHAVHEGIQGSGSIEVSLAELEDRPIAGMVTARSGSTVHYLHGGIDYDYRRHCASDLLVFEALVRAMAHGASTFDFGGTDPSDEGLLHFKRKWGAVVTNCPVLGMDLDRMKCVFLDTALKLLGLPVIRGLYNPGRKRI